MKHEWCFNIKSHSRRSGSELLMAPVLVGGRWGEADLGSADNNKSHLKSTRQGKDHNCFLGHCQPVDQHLSAAWSAPESRLNSTWQPLDHCLLSCGINAYSSANQPLNSRVIIVCKPLDQRLSDTWSAPNHPLDQRIFSGVISTCQPLDKLLYTTWSTPN